MGYFLTREQMEEVCQTMRTQAYIKICSPKLMCGRVGRQEVRYGEIRHLDEIVTERKSDYGPKELIYPVSQTLLYFRGSEVEVNPLKDERDMLIFARACDIHAIQRLDEIFMHNGGQTEYYYARLRQRAKFILLECQESFDTCFCVSMGSNKTTDYAAAVRFDAQGVWVEVKDRSLEAYFAKAEPADYEPAFIKENKRKVQLPDITDREMLKDIINLDYWKQFDERCILCGGCNTVCPSCSCFDTNDITYDETSFEGERRRTWSSCMLDSYTVMAGGHGVRQSAGQNMRFKTLHKIYDYKLRYGKNHMCVGCGRCDMKCPKEIHFSETIDGLAKEVEILKSSTAEGGK